MVNDANSKWLYHFDDIPALEKRFNTPNLSQRWDDVKRLLGGKGAGLLEMSRIGLPVPPGFSITTEICRYRFAHADSYPADFWPQVTDALAR